MTTESASAISPVSGVTSLPPWREEDGIIYFQLTSNGKIGGEWLLHFERKRLVIGCSAKDILLSENFVPLPKGTVTEIAVIRRTRLRDGQINARLIRDQVGALWPGFIQPSPEIACLILDCFGADGIRAMGLGWIAVMHEPFQVSDDGMVMMGAWALEPKKVGLSQHKADDSYTYWTPVAGLAFAVA